MKFQKICKLLCCLVLFASQSVMAQESGTKESQVEIEERIGQSKEIRIVFESPKGFLFMGTFETDRENTHSNSFIFGKKVLDKNNFEVTPYVGYETTKEPTSSEHSVIIGSRISYSAGRFSNEIEQFHLRKNLSDKSMALRFENTASIKIPKILSLGNFTSLDKSRDEKDFQTGPYLEITKRHHSFHFAVMMDNTRHLAARVGGTIRF